jgi:hypothetical protein
MPTAQRPKLRRVRIAYHLTVRHLHGLFASVGEAIMVAVRFTGKRHDPPMMNAIRENRPP